MIKFGDNGLIYLNLVFILQALCMVRHTVISHDNKKTQAVSKKIS